MGQLNGSANSAANHAVSAFSYSQSSAADQLEFETVTPIPLVASGRFLTFSVNVAETACSSAHAQLKFYLVDGATVVPTFTTPIDPCAGGTQFATNARYGTYYGNKAYLFDGSSVGIQMGNGSGETNGNDHAFEDVTIVDATPQLDKSFSPTGIPAGGTSVLTFTVTNTSELASKSGFSFTDAFPAGLQVAATPGFASTCPAATGTPSAGGISLTMGGNIAAGVKSCTFKVNVTATATGTTKTAPAT